MDKKIIEVIDYLKESIEHFRKPIRDALGVLCEKVGIDGALDYLSIEEMFDEIKKRGLLIDCAPFSERNDEAVLYILDPNRKIDHLLAMVYFQVETKGDTTTITVSEVTDEGIAQINEDYRNWRGDRS